jgi:hypothetical protein
MRWCGSLLLAAACCAVPLTVRAGCVPLGGHFTTAAKCCPGLCYTKGAEFVTCQPCATTTTVVQTTSTTMVTTSTVAGQTTTSTTSTTIPSSGLPDLGLRFTPTDLAPTPSVPAGYASAPFPDPRTGLPATEFVKAVIGWQLMALAADTVNAADAAGCTVNQQQLEDALWKFGLNYVLLHTGGPQVHGSYAWLNPTYVRQYTLEPLLSAYPCIRAAGMVDATLEQLGGYEQGARTPAPVGLSTDPNAGKLVYTPGHYARLTTAQCSAQAAAEDAHHAHDQALIDCWLAALPASGAPLPTTGQVACPAAEANNAAVKATQLAFERTAETLDQQQLFLAEWAPSVSPNLPIDVAIGLTQQIIAAHMAMTAAFHCDTQALPDATAWIEASLRHAQLHLCRATTHWLDRPIRTACTDQSIDDCPRMTCRQLATEMP